MDNDMLKFFMAMMSGEPLIQDTVGTDAIDDYIVDTCCTVDCGWETGVCKRPGDKWIIVQRYPDKETATKGHGILCGVCAGHPEKIYSVQTGRYEVF